MCRIINNKEIFRMRLIYISLFLLYLSTSSTSLAITKTSAGRSHLGTKQGTKVLVPISDGFEDLEAVTIVDMLRRAGAIVTIASIYSDRDTVKGMMNTQITKDASLADVINDDYDLIVLPGGTKNAQNLANSTILIQKLKEQKAAGKWYAAICASPAIVFVPNGLMEGVEGTSFGGDYFEAYWNDAGLTRLAQRVVVSKNCITSEGPGTAMEFAVALIANVISQEKADSLVDALYICKTCGS